MSALDPIDKQPPLPNAAATMMPPTGRPWKAIGGVALALVLLGLLLVGSLAGLAYGIAALRGQSKELALAAKRKNEEEYARLREASNVPVKDLAEAIALAERGSQVDIIRLVPYVDNYNLEGMPNTEHLLLDHAIEQLTERLDDESSKVRCLGALRHWRFKMESAIAQVEKVREHERALHPVPKYQPALPTSDRPTYDPYSVVKKVGIEREKPATRRSPPTVDLSPNASPSAQRIMEGVRQRRIEREAEYQRRLEADGERDREREELFQRSLRDAQIPR